jgi:hypothetical protein
MKVFIELIILIAFVPSLLMAQKETVPLTPEEATQIDLVMKKIGEIWQDSLEDHKDRDTAIDIAIGNLRLLPEVTRAEKMHTGEIHVTILNKVSTVIFTQPTYLDENQLSAEAKENLNIRRDITQKRKYIEETFGLNSSEAKEFRAKEARLLMILGKDNAKIRQELGLKDAPPAVED